MRLSSTNLLGEAQDSIDELRAKIDREEYFYKTTVSNIDNQLQLVRDARLQFNTQLSDAVSEMEIVQNRVRRLEQDLADGRADYLSRESRCEDIVKDLKDIKLCNLRSLRAVIVKKSSMGIDLLSIVDCEVSEWSVSECSKLCDNTCGNATLFPTCGGSRESTRELIQQANTFGVHCLALTKVESCGQVECPVDCNVAAWSEWSICTRQCDGGLRTRTRSVEQQPEHGGALCDSTVEVQPCNAGACSEDCILQEWSEWSACSSGCGGGYQERIRQVANEAQGKDGRCPDDRSGQRYDLQKCNTNACSGTEQCSTRQNIVIAVDQSAYVTDAARIAQTSFIKQFLARFTGNGTNASRVGVVQFGNGDILPDGTVRTAHVVSRMTENVGDVELSLQDKLQNSDGFPNLGQGLRAAGELCSVDIRFEEFGGLRSCGSRVGVASFLNSMDACADGCRSNDDCLAFRFAEVANASLPAVCEFYSERSSDVAGCTTKYAGKVYDLIQPEPCVVVVLAGGRPPFMGQALLKSKQLSKRNIRTLVVSFASGADTDALKSIASEPQKANFLSLSGWEAFSATRLAMAADSCPSGGALEPRLLDASCVASTAAGCGSAAAAVRCCNADATTCRGVGLGCIISNFTHAEATCKSTGLRLCSPDELETGICCTPECGMSERLTWTSQESKRRWAVDMTLARACPESQSPAPS